MRTVTYGAACSLDGFIAAKDGSVDWLHFSLDVSGIMNGYWQTADTVLMGRKTWDVAAQLAGKNPYAGRETHVFSRTLETPPHPDVHLVSDNAAEFVLGLKRREGKGICVMGGGDFARSLFEAGAIDEVGLNIHPILLGSGIPLFLGTGVRIELELTQCRQIDGGCVYLLYRVRR